ncbi:MAG: acetyl-CoA synthetase [Desulfurococcales archaeon ex4484_58]|nr:MAG: acetyl-CoA synthetase [Desulfurococcales archaeon ex4484_58]
MEPREIIRRALEEGRSKLLEHEAYELVGSYNIPVPKAYLAKTPEEAGKLAEKIGYPIVLKIVSPDISHKSDVGGVILDLNSKEEVVEAAKKIFDNVSKKAPNARIAGVLVQEMVPYGLEVIVGGLRDGIFGSVVMFGIGGIFVELLRDVSFRIAPISEEEALEMINEIKASKLLEGYRGQPPIDKKALAKIIVNVGELLEENPEIQSIDLNPIMAYSSGAKVADARIIIKTK